MTASLDPSAAGFPAVAHHHPEVFAAYGAYVDAVWSSPDLPAGTLELCRLRLAQLLEVPAEQRVRLGVEVEGLEDKVAALAAWPTDPRFTAVDRACLAYAEQALMDVQGLDDATSAAVRDQVGDAGLVALALGVGLAEGMIRAAAVLGEPASSDWDRDAIIRYPSAADRGIASAVGRPVE